MLVTVQSCASLGQCASSFMKSIALNNVLPFRMGDLYRIVSLPNDVAKKSTTASTVIVERLLDLVTLVFILSGIIVFSDDIQLPQELETLLITVVFGLPVFLLLPLWLPLLLKAKNCLPASLAKQQKVQQALSAIDNFLIMTGRLFLFGNFLKLVGFSLLAWLFEASVFYVVGIGLDIELSAYFFLFFMCLGTLSTLIPSSPGYIGTFHFVLIMAVTSFGIAEVTAGAFAVIVHFILWGGTTLVGAAFFAHNHFLREKTNE